MKFTNAFLEDLMETSNTVKGPWAIVKKILIFSTLSVVVIFASWQLIWIFSGSEQWELIHEKKGVKIYSMKSPGSGLKKFKGTVRVQSSLGTLVEFMQDPDVCDDIGCYESRVIERIENEDSLFQYSSFRFDFPFPFITREYVTRAHFYQNPESKEVYYEIIATPDKVPPDDCCFRLEDMQNTWQFKPMGDGEIEIEYVLDMDLGGFVPSALMNSMYPNFIYGNLSNLQGFLDKEKYQNARIDFIDEAIN